MARVQKVYTKAFKEEAVELVQSSGKPTAQIARELGISDSALYMWQKEPAANGPDAFPGTGHQSVQEEAVVYFIEECRLPLYAPPFL